MDTFKIDNFRKDFPNKLFPEYHSLTNSELLVIQSKLYEAFEVNGGNNDLLIFVKLIQSIASAIDAVNAEEENFCLIALFSMCKIKLSDQVYLNWYRYDDVDRLSLYELDKYFDYIWYPGADDIDIFDDSFSWVLSIRHDGAVSLALKD